MAKEITQMEEIHLDNTKVDTVEKLKSWINNKYPAFSQFPSYMIAINHTYAIDDDKLKKEDEIAIIPPVSGG